MGVFVWATNSDIDEMTGGFPVISPSLNSNITEIAPSSEAE